jgi:catechol 2,3-dioxygenase-like lactoylglutathione lyase family enzyme
MQKLAHTGFTVRDLERSLVFYRDVLGMSVVFKQEKQGGYLAQIVGYENAHVRMAHLEFEPNGHRIELFEYREPEAHGDAGEPRDVGITHVCLAVKDIDAVFERATDAGADPISAPVLVDTGANAGGRGAYIRDPDGIIIELFQPRSG